MLSRGRACLAALVGALVLGGNQPATSQEGAPRTPAPRQRLQTVGPYEHRLIVKFGDGVRARAGADGRVASRVRAALPGVEALSSRLRLRFKPLLDLPEATLGQLEERAERRARRRQPDLAGMMIVEVPGADEATLVAVGDALQQLEEVEFAYLEPLGMPPPGDIAPQTPNLVANQTYRGDNPGMGVDYAWTQGGRGAGVRLSDCEYGWVYTHEDLNDLNLHPEPGQTPRAEVAANGWDEHGTAVMGETSAAVNAYGCSGMVPDATVYTYPEWTVEGGSRRATSIANAIANSSPGDIVLLEMQNNGAPAEVDPAVWTVVRSGVDAGVIVVAAAGNGGNDLDGPAYSAYRALGDSGAIIVGGGTPNAAHDKVAGSSFGSRVNVQGWWGGVFTLGYGGFAAYGGDKNQRYTAGFDGTSSATPFAASACVALQSVYKARFGKVLSPEELRFLLIQTGLPQGSGGHIGPFPDLRRAIDALGHFANGIWVDFSYVGAEDGSFERPYNTLAEGVAAVPAGWRVNFRAGQTAETMTISKPMTLVGWGGEVLLGR